MKTQRLEYESRHLTPWHRHASGQLYWISHGLMVIETELAQWVITPGSVGWFPAHLYHSARSPGKVTGKCLYPEPSATPRFSPHPTVYATNSFTLAVLERIYLNANSSAPVGYSDLLVKVLGCEIAQMAELPLQIILPEDRRARNVANELLNNPGSMLSQRQLAQRWGLSVRTLSRLFSQQTGISFSQWRQQAKVIASLQWLCAGLPVTEVASLSGYSNTSTYIETFRQRFGMTPGQFKASGLSPANDV